MIYQSLVSKNQERIIRMAQEFRKFRKLLDKAIGYKTQAQFAKEAGISAEHLNRMLNSPEINRPNKSTIKKLAAVAENAVTYKDFIDALNEEDPDFTKVDYKVLKNQEAAQDFAPNFKEKVRSSYQVLNEVLKQQKPVIVQNLDTYMADVLNVYQQQCKDNNIEPLEISYYICEAHYKYFGHKFETHSETAIEHRSVILSSAEGREAVESELLLYTMQVPFISDKFSYLVVGTSMAVEDLFEVYGLYGKMCGELQYDSEENLDLEKVLGQPFYLHFIEQEEPITRKAKERLLQAIFNDPDIKPTCITGTGFYINNIADDVFYQFIQKHKDTVLMRYHDNADLFKQKQDALDKIFALNHNADQTEKMAAELIEVLSYDLGENDFENKIILISEIMQLETGFSFYYYLPDYDDKYKDLLDTQSCIMVEDKAILYEHIQRTTLLHIIVRYCRELGIKEIGDIRYMCLERFHSEPMTYIVKDAKNKSNVSNNDVDTSNWNDASIKPERIGIYNVVLKDGRHMQCVYLTSHDVWVKRHKAWNTLLDKWDPQPLNEFKDTK